ncbi:MAG: hypothetical protein QM765_14655 [Myxococcales bacterium]
MTFSWPATLSSVYLGSMNSSRPWHSAWMISFFFSFRPSGVMRVARSMASVSTRSRCTRDRPAVILARPSTGMSLTSLIFLPSRRVLTKSLRSSSLGRSMEMAAA